MLASDLPSSTPNTRIEKGSEVISLSDLLTSTVIFSLKVSIASVFSRASSYPSTTSNIPL